jgi:hypothetical protein
MGICMLNKIVVVSVYNKAYEEIYQLTYPHNKKYFDFYNIEYKPIFIECDNDVAKNCYKKFEIVNELLESEQDISYIWSMDIDIVICNFTTDLRNIMSMTSKDLLFCSVLECDPDMYWNINAGSIIIKNSINGRYLIDQYMSIAKTHNFKINDQVLWQQLLRYNESIRKHVAVFPANVFNAGGAERFLHHELSASSTVLGSEEACKQKISILKDTIGKINDKQNLHIL